MPLFVVPSIKSRCPANYYDGPLLRAFKGQVLDICYNAPYTSRDQQRFAVSEVAADWHELLIRQCITWPSTARANGKFDILDRDLRIGNFRSNRISNRIGG